MEKNKKKNDFRIVVGLDDCFSSAIWSVLIRGSDVIIMNQHGSEHKITLHKSGECHSAITSEHWDSTREKFNLNPQSRCNNKWFIDVPSLGYADAFNLVFPFDEIKDRSGKSKQSLKELVRVPLLLAPLSPYEQKANSTIIKFIKAKPEIDENALSRLLHVTIIKSINLNSEENLLVGYYYTNDLSCELQFLRRILKQKTTGMDSSYVYDNSFFSFELNGKHYHVTFDL